MLSRRLFTVALSALILCGCPKKDDAPKPDGEGGTTSAAASGEIPVGAFLSLSGADATFGKDASEGMQLAIDEVNAAGGVKGRKIKLIVEDDKSTTLEASQKVRQLIDRNKVVAVLGEVASSRSLAGGLICNTSHVPMVSPSSTAVSVTKDREWVFRTCFTDDKQGQVAARFVHDTLKKTKIGILYAAQDTYSSGLAQSFRDETKKLGGTVVVDKGYQKGDTNFRTYLSELKAASPEIIFVPNYYNEMAPIARQAKEIGIAGTSFVGGDGWDSTDLLKNAGEELEGAYFTNHYAPDVPWPNSKKFLAAFMSKYHRDPPANGAQGYDAARVLVDAMNRAPEITPEAIKKALSETKDFQGATGKLTIDKDRNATKPVVVVQIKGGKFTYSTELMAE